MTDIISADSLHRLVKQAMDSGRAASVDEAMDLFRGYRLAIEFPRCVADDPVHQATFLTAIALGKRVFLGGVTVTGALDRPLATPSPYGKTLAEAALALGALGGVTPTDAPTIVIGSRGERRPGLCIRTAATGWRGGVLPIDSELEPEPGPSNPIAGMLAAALAINEAFLHVDRGPSAAGHRVTGLSLWQPAPTVDWLVEDPTEPPLSYLPSNLWLIGLGHLGQAYLWALGLLPYRTPGELSLVLQDIDFITDSTESTSVLTRADMVGVRKTRAMAAWADARGFRNTICERLFDAHLVRHPGEPAIALCGLDNAAGRRALDRVGFDLVVEAGLGRGHRDFRTLRLHTLPGERPASEIWKNPAVGENVEHQPAYEQLRAQGKLDRCGMTMLAGKAVGAPFVGAVAASLAMSEVLRLLHGGNAHRVIDLDLLAIDHRLASVHPRNFSALNPGYTLATAPEMTLRTNSTLAFTASAEVLQFDLAQSPT